MISNGIFGAIQIGKLTWNTLPILLFTTQSFIAWIGSSIDFPLKSIDFYLLLNRYERHTGVRLNHHFAMNTQLFISLLFELFCSVLVWSSLSYVLLFSKQSLKSRASERNRTDDERWWSTALHLNLKLNSNHTWVILYVRVTLCAIWRY